MADWMGFVLQLVGLTLAATGFLWFLSRVFAQSEPWGTAIFFFPPLALVYFLMSFRRAWAPVLLLLLGAAVVASPVALKHFQKHFLDLDELVMEVDGERHVTLTRWNKNDYSILENYLDAVVLQMGNGDVTDETLKYLSGMTRLRELDLNDSQVTDAGLKLLSHLPNLQQIRLSRTKITDQGFRENLLPMESLRQVEVTGTGVKGSTLREWKKMQPDRKYLP
jgi:Leucine Rich repeat